MRCEVRREMRSPRGERCMGHADAASVWGMQTSHHQQASSPTHIGMPMRTWACPLATPAVLLRPAALTAQRAAAARADPANSRRTCGPVAGGDAFMQWPMLHLQPCSLDLLLFACTLSVSRALRLYCLYAVQCRPCARARNVRRLRLMCMGT